MPVEYVCEPEYLEYLDGKVHPKVSPRIRHALVQGAFSELLRRCGRGIGVGGPEWRIRLRTGSERTELQPDVSFVSFARLQPLSERERDILPFAPDVAVEVRSPGDLSSYLEKKIERYLAYGALVVFDVDPAARTLRAITKKAARVLRPGETFEDAEIPWLAFTIDDVFADLDAMR
jgi:Uma2 family endonuclease